jgi:hypothetical protein
MKQYVVYFAPGDRKILFNQFHTIASSIKEAQENCQRDVPFSHSILGVGIETDMSRKFVNGTIV